MPTERPSGYFRDVEKWNGSRSVQRMTFAERGVYQAMLDEQWERRWLPDDAGQVADRIAITEEQRTEVLAAWPKVRGKFVHAEAGTTRIYNVKLEKTRRKQRASFVLRQESGRTAGKASAAKRLANKALPSNESLTTVERPSTVLVSKEKNREVQRRGEGDEFAALWNAHTHSPIARCLKVTDQRRRHIAARWRERPLVEWIAVFDRIQASEFCRGVNDRRWLATFDWLIEKADSAVKVLEGKYDNRLRAVPHVPAKDYTWPCPHGLSHSESQCKTQQVIERGRAERAAS